MPHTNRNTTLLWSTQGLLIGTLLACGAAGCALESAESVEPPPSQMPTPPGGKADSPTVGFGEEMWAEIATRCGAPAEDEPVVYGNDFRWDYTPAEMATRFTEIYGSGKRLSKRASYDAETATFLLPSVDMWGGPVTLPRRFVENVTLHIERALELTYAEHVFFPDMGHNHFFIPQDRWEAEYAGGAVSETSSMYGRLIDDPQLLVFYHTAEQLGMLDENDELLPDPWIQWRHQSRNVVGDNNWEGRVELLQNPESPANTAHDYPDHFYYGAGMNVSGSADGCFPYHQDGELRWYDLSLYDLPYKSDGGGGDYF
ncbi:MAG: hypothetical protein JRI68_11940 [Deltaproteobacteria bacterium]|nr:hypothetical protein [Deltaproteobacteria bacterium]